MEKVTNKRVIELFGFKPIFEEFDVKVIKSAAIHRKGLELVGAYQSKKVATRRVIIGWGTIENNYLSGLKAEKREEAISNVINEKTPLVILSGGINNEILGNIVDVAKKYRVPVAKVDIHLAEVSLDVSGYLVRKFAIQKSVHGSLVTINGVGVMIIGKSGVGKSEAVLELIQKGHSFISDDTVILKRIGNKFFGEPATITKNLLEARGIGIINIPHIYGSRAVKETVEVELVIELVTPIKSEIEFDRLGLEELRYDVLGHQIKLIKLPIYPGRSISSMLESATNVYIARRNGMDPLEIIKMNGRK